MSRTESPQQSFDSSDYTVNMFCMMIANTPDLNMLYQNSLYNRKLACV